MRKGNSEESMIKASKLRNTTGYFRVTSAFCEDCVQGWYYIYSYRENGKVKRFCSTKIEKLEEKVKFRGLRWVKF